MEPDVDDEPVKKPAAGGTKFVPDTRPVKAESGKEPPAWAIAVILGIIGFVVLMFMLGQWDRGSFVRSLIPYANSDYFWVGLIFLPMAALLIVATAVKLVELRKSASWSTATGRIVRSEIEARRHRFGNDAETVRNEPAVEYEFKAGGRTVRGSRIAIGDDSGGENTEATLARYPVGAAVTVFYDADNPKSCVLERDGPKGVTTQSCLGALAGLAIFGVAIGWLVTRGPDFVRANFPDATANPEFIVAIAGLGLGLLLLGLGMRRYSNQAASWPSAPGKIVRSEVESYRKRIGSGGNMTTMYRPVVEFTYAVRGREYRGNQITLMTEVSGSEAYAGKVAAKYPAGSTVTVHYDPANPGTAALEHSTGMAWYPLALAAGCFALAVWQAGVFR